MFDEKWYKDFCKKTGTKYIAPQKQQDFKMSMSKEEIIKNHKKKNKSKYNNKKITVDGIQFDSIKEARYYKELKILKKAGEIVDFELQPKFELQPGYRKNGKKIQAINYIADFLITHKDGTKEVVDVKGMKTQVYKIKKKMFEYQYDYTITEI